MWFSHLRHVGSRLPFLLIMMGGEGQRGGWEELSEVARGCRRGFCCGLQDGIGGRGFYMSVRLSLTFPPSTTPPKHQV